jgi:hypothetical protein
LTEYSDLSEAETEETETAAAVMIETVVEVIIKTAEATETVAAVMTMAEKAAADVTDGTGGDRRHIGGNTGS